MKKKDNGIRIVQYDIADIQLNIPRAFHYRDYEKRGNWPNVKPGRHKVSSITLVAVLPELESVNGKNQHLFKELGWGQKISITLRYSAPFDLQRGLEYNQQQGVLIQQKESKYGLTHYVRSLVKGSKPYEDYFVSYQGGSATLIARCSLPSSVPSPACEFDRVLSNGIHLNYIYSLKYFEQWQSIESELLKLLESFCQQQTTCIQLTEEMNGLNS